MKAIVKMAKDESMRDYWTKYQLEIVDCNYSDRIKLKNMKLMWNPRNKSWYCSGSFKTNEVDVYAMLHKRIVSNLGNIEINVV